MNIQSLNSEINNISQNLISSGMALDYNFSKYDCKTNAITFCKQQNLFDILSSKDPIERHKKFIEGKYYNCLLFDGALLQFFYKFKSKELISHRLAYIPSPICITMDELAEFSFVEILEKVENIPNELKKRIQEYTILRFDYDVENANIYHPASHFTILKSNCRIPVCSPLTPLMFLNFVLNNFYNNDFLESNNINIKKIEELKSIKSHCFNAEKNIQIQHKKFFYFNIE